MTIDFLEKERRRKGRTIIVALLCIAIVSMLLGWAKFPLVTETGLGLSLLFLFAFWAYPVISAIFLLPINNKWGGRFAVLNVIIVSTILIFIATKTIGGISVDVGSGAWLYLFSSLALLGAITHRSEIKSTN